MEILSTASEKAEQAKREASRESVVRMNIGSRTTNIGVNGQRQSLKGMPGSETLRLQTRAFSYCLPLVD